MRSADRRKAGQVHDALVRRIGTDDGPPAWHGFHGSVYHVLTDFDVAPREAQINVIAPLPILASV